MRSLIARTIRHAIAATALASAAALGAAPGAIADNTSDFNHAFTLGLQGFTYGEPLMDTQSVFKTETSVTVPDHQGDAPVNQWSHTTALADTKEGIIAPNADTLYSIAWLALKTQPIIVHVPNTGGHFNVVPLLTPYEENTANIGNGFSGGLMPGNYMIAGPNYRWCLKRTRARLSGARTRRPTASKAHRCQGGKWVVVP